MFNKKKKDPTFVEYEIPAKKVMEYSKPDPRKQIDAVSEAMEEKYGPMTDERMEEISKPQAHQKINPIIAIKDVNNDYPVLINQATGEATNIHTYYAELLDNVRSRAKMLAEKKGLEYELLICEETSPEQRLDLLASHNEAIDATLSIALAEDLVTTMKSVACNIEEKVMSFLENLSLEGYTPKSIFVPDTNTIMKMFSWGYPNKSIDTFEISGATYFDFIANRKLQIMNNFCTGVYEFMRAVAYDPTMDIANQFDTRDTMYAMLCNGIYGDLACLDDALGALITVHCIRVENCQSPARGIYQEVFNHKTPKLPESN